MINLLQSFSLSLGPQRSDMEMKLQRVRKLLEKLDNFECLFPSLNYMMKVVNFDKKLKDRIAVLNMWYKTTLYLYETIREVKNFCFFCIYLSSSTNISQDQFFWSHRLVKVLGWRNFGSSRCLVSTVVFVNRHIRVRDSHSITFILAII